MISNLKGEALVQKIRFLTVGVVGFVTNYIILTIAIYFGMHQVNGEIVAAVFALQVTFMLHDRWTYYNKASPLKLALHRRYILYITSNSFGSLMTVVIFSLTTRFIDFHLISLGLAAVAAMIWNYMINKFIIWRHQHVLPVDQVL